MGNEALAPHFSLYLVQNRDCSLLLPRVEMRIRIPGLFDFCVPETSGDLLDIDAFVCKKACVTVPEIVNSYMRKLRRSGIFSIRVLYAGVAKASVSATDAEILAPVAVLPLLVPMLRQYV